MIYQNTSNNDSLHVLKRTSADWIDKFGDSFTRIKMAYDGFGFVYPEECHTNYRDSWFHYRKLYTRKDKVAIYKEQYAMEEHLLRAFKDGQINFLQQLCQCLEVWYHCDDIMCYDKNKEMIYQTMLKVTDGNWVEKVWQASKENEEIFSATCVYYYQTRMESSDLKKQLQRFIHGIKNIILDLRGSGVNIYRPDDNIKYLNECMHMHNEVCISLQKINMQYLISPSKLIYRHCRRHN